MIKVLIVDDSAFARKVVREVLGAERDITVVGTARDGLEALEKIRDLKPDVVTLDLVMPHLDGLGVLGAPPAEGAPAFLVVSTSDADSELAVRALQLGAFDVVHKPTALASERLYALDAELVEKVRIAASSRAGRAASGQARALAPAVSFGVAPDLSRAIVVIGTSTGGPQALTRVLTSLPADFGAPIAVVVHMPPGYTAALAQRLDKESALGVVEARDGMPLRKGTAILAQAGVHLAVDAGIEGPCVRLDAEPSHSLHRPSVDVLFSTAARIYGAGVLGVVLTGMGDDGLLGSTAIKNAGGRILVEHESTCVVFGMPRRVHEAGLASAMLPLDEMAAEIVRRLAFA